LSFHIKNKKEVLITAPFKVEELELEHTDGTSTQHSYFRLNCGDWVNILPITIDRKVILIEQPRAGTLSLVLETPGGMIEPTERDATMAAARELEEETGFTSMRFLPLANMNPNPAIMTNTCHFFIALGCQLNPQRKHFPDSEERIRIVLTPIEELDLMVRTGRINHSLSALCIMLGMKYLNQGHS